MKLIILSLLIYLNLYADAKLEMLQLFQNNKYEAACNLGFEHFKYYKQEDEFLSLYAFSCLQSDLIDRLAMPLAMLKYSKEARANAAYFSIILMQKKLLYHALVDGYDLENLNLPTTDYILSKVFDFYSKLKKHDKRSVYIFDDLHDPKLSYKLYILEEERISKMVIEEFYDTIVIKRHIYW
ncbi:MAG TPA: hypothetical protein CFH84_05540 [Sulfurimonas sp. UBA12504]|nr:MAG: hypothetical protein A2019_08380 [Sulfurimonas sp. GWF2_37_8]DAB30169.1 MAG TPA: hypothetical protein CFH84_05540 [Sulfurimonas sp. UBA12504]